MGTAASALQTAVVALASLFGSDAMFDRFNSPTAIHTQSRNTMPESQAGLGKRKRRMEDGDEGSRSRHERCSGHTIQMDVDIAGISNFHSRSSPISKGLLRLHGHGPIFEASGSRMFPASAAASTYTTSDRRPVKQLRRLNPKIALVKAPSYLMDIEPDPTPSSSSTGSTESHTNSDLRPCHACKTAPKRKRDLENYMGCKRCDGRTCYICARECLGCHKAICKKCIVEVGEEGDPWCLECYSRHINS